MIKNKILLIGILLLILFSVSLVFASSGADTAGNSLPVFDLGRVSMPIGTKANGWVASGIGMFVVLFCLVIISSAINILPNILTVLNKFFPENTPEVKKAETKDTSSLEVIAAATAVAYHNHNNDGK